MATLQERFDKVDANLDEASSELQAELQALRDALAAAQVTLPADAEASLSRVEAKSQALADIVPNAEPNP